jgi:tetratricopeptide (TPR) repeat protein
MLTSSLLGAAVSFTPTLKTIPDLVVQTRFNAARKVLHAEAEKGANGAVDYLQAATLCMDLFINADEETFNQQLPRIEEYLARIEALPEDEPWRNVFLGELKVALALLHAKFKSNLKGGWQCYQAYGLLEENAKRFPDFTPTYMAFGVLQVTLGSLPEDYRSIASFFGIKGDLTVGLNMLKKAYWRCTADDEFAFMRNYYGFVYSFVNFQLYEENKVSPEQLNLPLKKAGFLVFLQATIEAKEGKMRKAVTLLQNRPRYTGETPFYYLDYLTGKYALSFDPELAFKSFQSFLDRPQNDPYKKSTYRFIAWYHILKNQKGEVERYRFKAINEGSTSLGADKQALLEAKEGFNYTLVKGRLYFDGAAYTKALSILEAQTLETCCPSVDEKVEWYYRRGRCLEEMGERAKAMDAFRGAIALPEANSSYALANSYLQLGLLYVKVGEKKQAQQTLKQVLKHKGFPFYEGLHQRAKTALAEL